MKFLRYAIEFLYGLGVLFIILILGTMLIRMWGF